MRYVILVGTKKGELRWISNSGYLTTRRTEAFAFTKTEARACIRSSEYKDRGMKIVPRSAS